MPSFLDELSEALGNLSASADGAEGSSGNPADVLAPSQAGSAPAAPVLQPGEMTAQDAADRIAALYKTVQDQAQRILTVYGTKIPCEVAARYETALQAYLAVAKNVFDQIVAQNGSVTQRLLDASGKQIGEITGPNPAIPTMFQVAGCASNIVPLAAALGAVPTGRVELGFAVPLAVWIIVAIGVSGGIVAYVVIKSWPNKAVQAVEAQSAWLDVRLGCVEKRMKLGAASTAAAEALCRGDMQGLQVPNVPSADEPQKSDFFRTVGIATIILLAGAAAAYFLMRNPKSRAVIEDMRARARMLRKDARKMAQVPGTAEVAGYLSGYAERLEDHADELDGYLEPTYILGR